MFFLVIVISYEPCVQQLSLRSVYFQQGRDFCRGGREGGMEFCSPKNSKARRISKLHVHATTYTAMVEIACFLSTTPMAVADIWPLVFIGNRYRKSPAQCGLELVYHVVVDQIQSETV